MPSAATFNTMISSGWLKANPANPLRSRLWRGRGRGHGVLPGCEGSGPVDPISELGFVYKTSRRKGDSGYQLYVYFWHGNSAALSCIESGMSRGRMFVHGAASLNSSSGAAVWTNAARTRPAAALWSCAGAACRRQAARHVRHPDRTSLGHEDTFRAAWSAPLRPRGRGRIRVRRSRDRPARRSSGHPGRFGRGSKRPSLRVHPPPRHIARPFRGLAEGAVRPPRVHVRGNDFRRGPRSIVRSRSGRCDDDLQLPVHELGASSPAPRQAPPSPRLRHAEWRLAGPTAGRRAPFLLLRGPDLHQPALFRAE